MFPYTLTQESLMVIIDGESLTALAGTPEYSKCRTALFEGDYDTIRQTLSKGQTVETWSSGILEYKQGSLWYGDVMMPACIYDKIVEAVEAKEDPTYLANFFKRLSRNPSYRVQNELFSFLSASNTAISSDGYVLAYKSVQDDWWDQHTGCTHRYEIGSVITMPRYKVEDDPRTACASGLHAGSLDYVKQTYRNGRTIVVGIDPEDVVSVPYDYDSQKLRACRLYVLREFDGALPNTVSNELVEMAPEDVDDDKQQHDDRLEAAYRDRKLHDLRDYARGIGMPRVSRIPGGKEALIKAIIAFKNSQ